MRGGTVKALGVTTVKPTPLLSDLPTVAQTVPEYETASWFGVGVRAGVPEEIVAAIEKAVREVVQEPVVRERMAAVIADPVLSDRQHFAQFIAAERKKWGTLIQELGLRLE